MAILISFVLKIQTLIYIFFTLVFTCFLFVSLLSTVLGERRGRTIVSAKWEKMTLIEYMVV